MWRIWLNKITNAIQESALDTTVRHREQKNDKLKSKKTREGEK